jgi:hypothetical protein
MVVMLSKMFWPRLILWEIQIYQLSLFEPTQQETLNVSRQIRLWLSTFD